MNGRFRLFFGDFEVLIQSDVENEKPTRQVAISATN
jgi:hypothetical protein